MFNDIFLYRILFYVRDDWFKMVIILFFFKKNNIIVVINYLYMFVYVIKYV